MPRPPKADAEATRRKILEAACELLVEQGPEALTTRAIARRAGVSPALVNHHYIDRAGLIDVVIETVYEEVHELGQELIDRARDGEDLAALVELAVRRMFQKVCANRPFMRLHQAMIAATGQLDPARRERTQIPFMSAVAALLAPRSPHDVPELRMRVRSITILVGRYGTLGDKELRTQTGEADDPLAVVESHLVGLAREMIFGAA